MIGWVSLELGTKFSQDSTFSKWWRMTCAHTWTLVPSEKKELLYIIHLLEEKTLDKFSDCLSLHRGLAPQWPRTFHLNYRNEGEKWKGKGTPMLRGDIIGVLHIY